MLDHDQFPERGHLDPEVASQWLGRVKTPYHESLLKLMDIVRGKVVESSRAGSTGFILFFDDRSWVISYLNQDKLDARYGTAELRDEDARLLGFEGAIIPPSQKEDEPYSWEQCNPASEISKSHGKPVRGIALGENCFNFCFPGGRELDTRVSTDEMGTTSYSVFWEQW